MALVLLDRREKLLGALPQLESLFAADIASTLDAMSFYGIPIPRVYFAFYTVEQQKCLLGANVEDGFVLFINDRTRIMDHNCLSRAVIFHEYAHYVNSRSGDPCSGGVEPDPEDPHEYSRWLRDEWKANRLLPRPELIGQRAIAVDAFTGEQFLPQLEEAYLQQ